MVEIKLTILLIQQRGHLQIDLRSTCKFRNFETIYINFIARIARRAVSLPSIVADALT